MKTTQRTNPKVSVVMATCNAGPFLRDNIDSILNQTYQNLEFIIIDDASTDDTAQIVKSYQDKRIVYLKHDKNIGQTASLNIGIKHSKGEYIARLDSDDIAYPERLELQVKYLDEHPEVGVVGSWSIDMDEDGKLLKPFKVPTDPLEVKCFVAASGDLTYWCISHPTVTIRKSVLDDIGLFNEVEGKGKGYPQDYELWERIARKYDLAVIDKILLKYRILKSSDSRYFFDKYRNHRWDITQRRIRHYLPDLKQQNFDILLHMLEYRPQTSKVKVAQVFDLFDIYMRAYLRSDALFKEAKPIIELMKLYYIPLLYFTNPLESTGAMFGIFVRYPLYLFNIKFYRKVFKALCQRFMSEEQFKELCKKTL